MLEDLLHARLAILSLLQHLLIIWHRGGGCGVVGRDGAGRGPKTKSLEPFDWVESSRAPFEPQRRQTEKERNEREASAFRIYISLYISRSKSRVAPFSPPSTVVIMLALHLAGSSRSPLVSERLRPLRMAVEGTGPGVGDYVYFAAVLALIPLIVGSVGSSARLPNEPAPLPHDPLATLARHTRSSLSVRRSSSSRATTRPTTQR